MPYTYTVYKVTWNKVGEGYTKKIEFRGVPEEFVEAGIMSSERAVTDSFGINIRKRQRGQPTRTIWEREWTPLPGEHKPFSTLPDKVDIDPVRSVPKEKDKQPAKEDGYVPSTWNYKVDKLATDVHKLEEENRDRRARGLKTLSYGEWKAGLK